MEAKEKVIELRKDNARGLSANQSALGHVRARIIEVDTKKANGLTDGSNPNPSETLPEEPFSSLMQSGKVIEPPFDLLTLSMLSEHSSELGQVIEAMEINIEGYGHRFISRLVKDLTDTPTDGEDSDDVAEDSPATRAPAVAAPQPAPAAPATPPGQPAKAPPAKPPVAAPTKKANDTPELKKARAEYADLVNFFTYCTQESFVQFRRKLRKDLESTGNAYFEVIRSKENEIQAFTHIPSYQVRLGRIDDDPRLVKRKILALQEDGSVELRDQAEWRRFRKFVQSRAIHRRTLHTIDGYKVRWFKEFGDDRQMDKFTGEYGTDSVPIPADKLANEIIHLKLYSARTPYGLPRYIGNLLSIFGDRASEEINYITFRNNNIPSMVVCVSNGQLTEGTIARIQSFVDSQIQGSDNYSKFLIIEGEPLADEGEDGGQVKVDVKPLVSDQHKDALFQNYSKNNQDKIRRAFRLPPIFVGRSDDYSRSTAESSRRLADEQVFAPERDEFDQLINRIIFPAMGVLFHKFRSNSPNTTDNAQLVAILAGAEKTGGMTPRIARRVLEEVLGAELPEMPKGFPADVPFSLTMAEAVKNLAQPNEPGQQVTALKALKDLGMIGDDGNLDLKLDLANDGIADVTKKLLALQAAADQLWRAQAGLSEGG